ncbi:MAG TPA: undecaprenyl-diphosphate phosphatase [Solirubrobacteraceae bacterium]
MPFLHAIVLGIVQGLTEFLPISSSGHLRIVPAFLGWEDPGAAFTAVTQLGTVSAVLLYFRRDLIGIVRAAFAGLRDPAARTTQEFKLAVLITIGTIPLGVLGFLFRHQIEEGARSLTLIGTTLIVLGLLLLVAERVSTRRRELDSLTTRDGVIIGFAQALALVPGVSRSGSTITAGLLLNFDRAAAARYSFLLSVPAVVISGLFELRDIGEAGGASFGATALATLLAFITGYASIAFLLRFLVNHSTAIFVAYRVVLGAVVLVLVSTGTIA